MKYITRIQKKIIGFKPRTHWKIILVITFLLMSCGVIYTIYMYIYALQQIEKTTDTVVPTRATSTMDVRIEEMFQVYKDRGTLYTSIIQTLSKNNVAASSSLSSLLVSSTTLATSSKQ